jgi:hypothetical protein
MANSDVSKLAITVVVYLIRKVGDTEQACFANPADKGTILGVYLMGMRIILQQDAFR